MHKIKELTQKYNVSWTVKGKSERSSIPLGNGEVGISFWVEENGGMNFYVARTDALSETDRLLKMGKVSINLSPNPFEKGKDFLQTLHIYDGYVEIVADKDNVIRVFVAKDEDSILVDGKFSVPTTVTAKYINWRLNTTKDENEISNAGEKYDVLKNIDNRVVSYHQNGKTIVEYSAKLQALENYVDKIKDPLANRVFGCSMAIDGGVTTSDGIIEKASSNEFSLKVKAISEQNENIDNWIDKLLENSSPNNLSDLFENTKKWWNEYFEKSYIFVNGDKPAKAEYTQKLIETSTEPMGENENDSPSKITQSYILTKFMFACSAYGNFPIRFNGLLFNLTEAKDSGWTGFDTKFSEIPPEVSEKYNPDKRSWGHMNLWQNQRLPYYSMIARGEIESIKPLFDYYMSFADINREKAKVYYDAEGQYNTEITTSFGLQPNGIYGEDRKGKPDGYSQNRYGGAVDISPGLELVSMMLDYYDFTSDTEFLQNTIIPYAKDLLLYVQTRFKERKNGKIVISPLQCVETYWDTTNPITVVVGMHAVIDRIIDIDKEFDKEFFYKTKQITPDIPKTKVDGKEVLSPAEIYDDNPNNVEPVEVYSVFPFKKYVFNNDDENIAKDTYTYRVHGDYKGHSENGDEPLQIFRPRILGEELYKPSYSGWQYIGMCAALLGFCDDAKTVLENNCALKNPGNRFPAMWGGIYDAVPDTDHGANILNTLQLMAMQVYGDKIYILPTWHEKWDISFKLYPFVDTCVECEYKNGKLEKLIVTPESRRKDVILKNDDIIV